MLVGVSGDARLEKLRNTPGQTEKPFPTCFSNCEKLIFKITWNSTTDLISSSGLWVLILKRILLDLKLGCTYFKKDF